MASDEFCTPGMGWRSQLVQIRTVRLWPGLPVHSRARQLTLAGQLQAIFHGAT